MRRPHDLVVIECVPGLYVPPGTCEMVARKYDAWCKRRGLTPEKLRALDDMPFKFGKGARGRGRPRKDRSGAMVSDRD